MSNIINKVKDALSGDHKHSDPEGHRASDLNTTDNTAAYSGTTGTTGAAGDYSTSTTGTSGLNTTGNTAGYSGSAGTAGTSGVGSYGEAREGQQGPHSSRIANTLDPRVSSSDADGSRTVGTTGYGSNNAGYGSSTTTTDTSNLGASYGETREGQQGPHSSRIANTLDPRVHSDGDGTRTVGSTGYDSNTGNTGYGADSTTSTGYGSTTGNTGYGTDSTTSNTGYGAGVGAGSYGSGSGPAPNTAGPHKSDTLNKLDPRVHSADGTVVDNQTNQSGQQSAAYSGPPDAAKLPPSALRRELGDPSIEHGDHGHDRERRNSAITHQEQHRGI